ncbi:MAG: hypothetical protein LBC85_00910 [Fibromonadaceae bacterium]|nr:hypothetical protein [Fibromonadaceae bacterium]
MLIFSLFACKEKGSVATEESKLNPIEELPEIVLKEPIIPTINVYLETTNRMEGYLRGKTDFKGVVLDYLSAVNGLNFPMNLYFHTTNSILPIRDFTNAIKNTFKGVKIHNFTSDYASGLDFILSRQNNDSAVSIFITGGILSGEHQHHSVRARINDYLKQNPNWAVKVYKLSSEFRGTYYYIDDSAIHLPCELRASPDRYCHWPKGGGKRYDIGEIACRNMVDTVESYPELKTVRSASWRVDLKPPYSEKACVGNNIERPYYIWVIGNEKNISEISKATRIAERSKEEPNTFFAMNSNIAFEYGFLDLQKPKRDPKNSAYDISEDKKTLSKWKTSVQGKKRNFAIGMDLKAFINIKGREYIESPNNYVVKINGKPSSEYELEISPMEDNLYTHQFLVTSNSRKSEYGNIEIILKGSIPGWVEEINDANGAEFRKTFGIKPILESFGTNRELFTAKLSLNR